MDFVFQSIPTSALPMIACLRLWPAILTAQAAAQLQQTSAADPASYTVNVTDLHSSTIILCGICGSLGASGITDKLMPR